MKFGLCLLLIVALATTALGIHGVPWRYRRDANATLSAPLQGANVTANSAASSDNPLYGPRYYTIDPANFMNHTFTTGLDGSMGNLPTSDGALQVGIRMGGPAEHIGTLRKHRLWQAIYDALWSACGVNTTYTCDAQGLGNKDNHAEAKIQGHAIVYNSGDNSWASNAHLTVSVRHAFFHGEEFFGLQEAMYRMAANAYMVMAEQDSNCYNIPFKGSRNTRMCNVSQRVAIGVPSNLSGSGDDTHANLLGLLVMDLSFNGKTAEGSVSCDDNMEHKIHDNLRDTGFDVATAKALKVPLAAFKDQEVSCADKQHDCMSWYEFRSWGDPDNICKDYPQNWYPGSTSPR